MNLYFDSAHIAKCYLNEPDGSKVRSLRKLFRDDVENRMWSLIPVSDQLLERVEFLVKSLPADCFVRLGDAIHATTAIDLAFTEIWTKTGTCSRPPVIPV